TQSVTLDDRGNLYVAGFFGGVLLYPPGADGAVAPTRRINGPTSGSGDTQVVVGPDRSLLVGQYGGPRLARVGGLVPRERPTAGSGLKVAGKKNAKKRPVTWAAGASLDAPISSYTVTVAKGAKTKVTATTTAPTYLVNAKKLKKPGTYTVTVTAT